MACRNPECRNGLTPGLVIQGKGNAKVPVLGATQRWGWIKCLACNAPQDAAKAGARYKDLRLSDEQIEQRAQLATMKAQYQPAAQGLASVASKAGTLSLRPQAPSARDEQMAKMLEQISQLNATVMKLTNQVSDLLEENRALRKQLEARPMSLPPEAPAKATA